MKSVVEALRGDVGAFTSGWVVAATKSVARGHVVVAREIRKPIRMQLLGKILALIPKGTASQRAVRAALALLTCGMFRAGELATRHGRAPVQRRQATWSRAGVAIQLWRAKNKQSATSQLVCYAGIGVCAATELKAAMDGAPDKSPGAPLLQHDDGSALDYREVLSSIKTLVAVLGLNPDEYGTHSCRAGGASELAALGISNPDLETLGRWAPGSASVRRYVRLTLRNRLDLARELGRRSL